MNDLIGGVILGMAIGFPMGAVCAFRARRR